MKKKIFTLLTLLLCVCSGVWADPTYKSTFTDWTSDGSGNYYTYLTETNYTTYITEGWMTYTGANAGKATLTIDPKDDSTISGTEQSYGKIKATSRYMDFYVTGVTSIKFYFRNNSGSVSRTAYYKLNGGSGTSLVAITKTSCNAGSISLNAATNNHIQIYSGTDEEIFLCALKVTPAAVPGPSFTMTTPATTTDVVINTSVVLTADEDITAVDGSITGTIKAGDAEATDITFSQSGRVLTYTPASVLAYNTTYVVKLNANQVQNASSEKNTEKTFIFKTMAAPSTGTTKYAAASGANLIVDNSWTISTDTKTLSSAGIPFTVVGTQKFEAGSNNYKFTINENDYPAVKVSKNGTYVITPGTGVTINSVTAYATSNSGSASAISSPGKSEQSLSARGAQGTPATPSGYALGKNEGNYQFTIGGDASQAIVVLVVNYDCIESIDVAVSSAGYATLYYDKNLTIPTGVTAYKAAVKDASTITITPIEGTVIPANTGVILKANKGTYNFVVTDEAAGGVTGNILTGTTTATTKEALGGTVFTLGQNSEGVVGLRNYTGTSIRAYSAYATTVSASRAFYPFSDDETTGINAVDTEAKEINDGVYYNLNGQRVTTPRKGLYIVNGKKVMVK